MTTSNIDTTGYVNLTLFDRSAQDIYADSLAYAQWVMPDWTPAETNTENVIMQALALMIAEGQYTINRLPNAVAEILLQLAGVTRVSGDYPTVTAKFTTIDSAGYTIPAGTEALYDLGDGGDPIVFTLNADVVISAGSNNGTGVMTGSLAESRFNSVAAGTTFTVVTPLSYLLSVQTTTLVSGGLDSESDAAYFNRGMLRLSRLSEALVLPSHFESYALEYSTSIYRAKCLDRYDPDLTGNVPGDNNGHVTVAVFGDGEPLSASQKTSLLTALQAASVSSLTLHVIDPEDINMVGVHATVVPLSSAGSQTTLDAVVASIQSYLSTATWPWATSLRWSNMVGTIESTTGVDYIATLSLTLNKIAWNSSLFYTSISNWTNTTNCTLAWESAISYSAIGGSMKITPAAAGNVVATSAAAAGANSYTATAAKEYWVSARIFVPAGQTARTCLVGVSWYTSGNSLVSSVDMSSGVVTVAGEWINVGQKFTAPGTTAKANIYVKVNSAGSSAEFFYVDSVTFSEYQTASTDVTLVGNGPLVMPAEIEVATA